MGIFRFFVCLFLLALGNSSIYAIDNGILTYELSEDGLQVTGCLDSCTGILSIPLEIQGEDVRSVGPYAFQGSGLTSVSIPDSVVLIDGYAFFRQGSLNDLTIGNSVETIGWMAFHSIGVSSVVIPDSVVSIHGRAFKNTTLSSLVIGNSVTQIGHEAFSGSGLSSVIIPNSVTYIEGDAFKGHALSSIIIGNSVTQIDDNAFSHAVGDVFIMRPAQEQLSIYDFPSTVNIYACDGLDEQDNPLSCGIAFPGQVREVLDAPAASLLIDEAGHADIPSHYSSIYPDAFGSKPLKTVSIPEGMVTIGDRAFRNTELTSLKIPNSVLSIGEKAFENVNLSSVIIGDSVTSIGFNAFSHLQGDLFILKPSDQRFEIFDFPSSSTIFECEGLDDSNLPFGCSEAYLDTFRYIVDAPAGRQLVDEDNHVVIPDGYTEIGREAFAGTNISSVQFPNGLTKIGPYAFQGSGLTSVSIPDSVVLIDGYAFFRQGSLNDLTIGNSVETIGWMAFHSIGVSSVVIPDSVVSIHGRAFKNTTLSSLVIGNSVTQIGHEAFSGSGLSSVIIPNSVTYIEGDAFKGHALSSIIIGNSVTQIDDNAFSHAVGDVFIMRPAQEQLSIYDFPSTVNIYACDGLDEQDNPLSCSPAWPDSDAKPLDQLLVGTWTFVQEANSLTAGVFPGDSSIWANSDSDLPSMDCMFDDRFIFKADGSYEFLYKGFTYAPWYFPYYDLLFTPCNLSLPQPLDTYALDTYGFWEVDNGFEGLDGFDTIIFINNEGIEDTYPNPITVESTRANLSIFNGQIWWNVSLVKLEDYDFDGVEDNLDNCPEIQNIDQENNDDDLLGNACDVDDDNDGVEDSADNCPFIYNTDQNNNDDDLLGNACDIDDDNDGFEDTFEIQNGFDPLFANLDIDNDGIANELDIDNDNDGVVNEIDVFPLDSSEQLDHDSDGIGNNADADDDNDNVMDVLDFFPLDAFESADTDGDGVGDNADFFPNSAEYSLDSDLDQMPDAWERKYGLNPTDASDAFLDQDNDGLTALEEYEAGTIPLMILDIDANGSFDALTDGLILLRYSFGLRGQALISDVIPEDANRTQAADIEAYIDSLVPGL